MPQVVVTRGSQITLTREVREKLDIHEGDVVTVNTMGGMVVMDAYLTEAMPKAGFHKTACPTLDRTAR